MFSDKEELEVGKISEHSIFMQTIDHYFPKETVKMLRSNPRKSSRTTKTKAKPSASASKKDDDKSKTSPDDPKKGETAAKKGATVPQKSASPAGPLSRAERRRIAYATIKRKWVDETTRKHWPLADIKHGGCRLICDEGMQIIKESLADCACLVGKERDDPKLLQEGIVVGHYFICRKTDGGVICEDGNHKLAFYRNVL